MLVPYRVLTLDIDGVLIDDQSTLTTALARSSIIEEEIEDYEKHSIAGMRLDSVRLLLELQKKYGFYIVISSSIRKLFDTEAAIKEHYEGSGFEDLVFHKDWKTTHHAQVYPGDAEDLAYWTKLSNYPLRTETIQYNRGHEIKDWLAKHPEVTQVVSIDDSLDFWPMSPKQCVWVKQGLANGGLFGMDQDYLINILDANFK